MRKVKVIPYCENWKHLFEEETTKLEKIFGSEILHIHHIGSTSIEGLKAKPIIDIMPVVKDINVIDHFINKMMAIGYTAKGENGIIGRRYFQKGGDMRTHHVHIYEIGSFEIERHLAFRDFLRVHKKMANKYGDLKEKLSFRYPYDIVSYILGKEQLGSEIETLALKWYQERVEFR